jgi:DnaK suppressor protein
VITETTSHAEIRSRLLARQRELSERRGRLSADRRREVEPLSADAPDRAIQQENDEVVDSITTAVETESLAITGALKRLEDGRYGICATCGAEISPTRLATVPYADQCQSCAAQANS